jgi:hypothetical protein
MHCYLAQAFVHGFLVVNPDLVLCYWKVDATRRGGLARFINHSCDVRPYSFFTLLSSLTWWKRCKCAGSKLVFIHAKPQYLSETVKGLQGYFLKTSALFLFESVPCQFLTLVGKIYRKANGCLVDVSDEKKMKDDQPET